MLSCARTIRDEILGEICALHARLPDMAAVRARHGSFIKLRYDYALVLCDLLAHLIELDGKLEDMAKTELHTSGTARRLT